MAPRLLALAAVLTALASPAAPLTVNAGNSPFTVTTSVNDTWDSVTVESGGTLIINGEIHVTAGDFVVQSGGVVRTTQGIALATIDAPGRVVDVQFGGLIDLNALGLLGGYRPGNATCSGQTHDPITLNVVAGSGQYAGGSSIVRGGGNSAPAFGGQTTVAFRGGGGGCGSSSGWLGGNGGGALQINAGTLRVDGAIQVNGGAASGSYAGGGAGGTLAASVGTLTGTGTLSAAGGAGSASGGAGGRVYVTLTTWSWAGAITTAPGAGNNGYPGGAQGVVYIRSAAGAQHVLGGEVTLGDLDSIQSVQFGAGGYLRLNGATSIANPVVVPAGATLELNATTALDSAAVASPVSGLLSVSQAVTHTGDLTINGSLLLNAQLTTTGAFTLSAGATGSHSQGDRDAALVAGTSLSIQGSFNASGRGCASNTRFDAVGLTCVGGVAQYTGGTYGGAGGNSNIAVYGAQESALELGSGGGYHDGNWPAGTGGGRVRLTAPTVNIGGSVLADGSAGSNYSAGGGSGGGIRIDATTFTGSGTLRAQGGNSSTGGSGGGGRIAVYYTTSTFTGAASAPAGNSSSGADGAQGTVYLRSAAGALSIRGGLVELGGADSVTSVSFGPGGYLRLNGPAQITNPIVVPTGGTLELNSGSALAAATLTSPIDGALVVTVPFTRAGDLTINGSLLLNAEFTAGGNFTLSAGATATHTQGDTGASLVAGGTLNIQGSFNVSARGCGSNTRFDVVSQGCLGGVGQYTGGTYGGSGGNTNIARYGTQEAAGDLGSGGGYHDGNWPGGSGGGSVRLQGATVNVSGSVIADGAAGSNYSAGGGSGGGIRIDATTFTGGGTLRAQGGNSSTGGSGGGGRIAVYYTTSTFNGSASAFAGASNGADGAQGTVYLRSASGVMSIRGGLVELSGSDAITGVIFGPSGYLRLNGPAQITNPIIVPSGATLELNAGTALLGATLASPIDGNLTVSVPFSRAGDLTINGSLLLNAELTIGGNFTLSSGGTATHSQADRDAALVVGGTLSLQGTMSLTGKGCPSNTRWDVVNLTCVSGVGQYTGGTYGGAGGNTNIGLYGAQEEAVDLGSAGGYHDGSWPGGSGGGRVRLTASTVNLTGSLVADGAAGSNYSAGGGAGGGIRIDATTFTGSGAIRAQGGNSSTGGSGGGGRIAIYYTTSTFTGTVTAFGGASNGADGAQGTVYLRSAGGTLSVRGGLTELKATDSVTSIAFGPAGYLRLNGGATITNPIVVPAGATLELASGAALSAASLQSPVDGTLVVSVPFNRPGNLTINGTVVLNDELTVGGDFLLSVGATATHSNQDRDAALVATGTINVQGVMNFTGKGCGSNQRYDTQTRTCVSGTQQYHGGTYGGLGGGGSGSTYGDPDVPAELGAGGGYHDGSWPGGAGGGAIRLQAPTVTIAGQLLVDGAPGSNYSAGGGSGGSIRINATTLNGAGLVRAQGGASNTGGAGSGGRIAINYTTFGYTGVIHAFGGNSNAWWGDGLQGTSRAKSAGATPDLRVVGGDYRVNGSQTFNWASATAGGVLFLDGPVTVTLPMNIGVGGTVWLNTADATDNIAIPSRIDGTLVVNAPMTLTQPRQVGGGLWTRHPVEVPQSMELLSGAVLRVDELFTLTGDLTLEPSAVITHSLNVRTNDLRVTGRIFVPVGAAIHADAVGYPGGYGGSFGCAGTSFDPVTQLVVGGVGQYGGGSYGGVGGGNTNPVYGSASNVNYPGAGGGCGGSSVWGGHGGGRLKLTASVLELFGHLRANGGNTTGNSAGGGAGGGIHVIAAALLGNGLIRANGGNASGGGGGGGRILLDIGNNTFTGLVEARGGTGSVAGQAGTVSTPSNSAPPTIVSVPAAVARVNAAWSYDADGLPQAVGAGPFTWSLVGGPPGATVNASTGAFSWTPTSLGRSNFTLRVSNVNGASDQNFAVDVLAPPAVTSSGAGTGLLNQPYHYNASDSLFVTGSAPFTYLATVAPAGAPSLSVDQTGRITWTPDSQGQYTPCVRVSNAVGSTDHCWNVTVSGQINPPQITSSPPLTGAVGLPYSYQVLATGTPPITFSFLPNASPAGATIDASGGQVQYTPPSVGTPYFCVRAQNLAGADTQCWDVAVIAAPEVPVFTSRCEPLAQVGSAYHYDADDTVNLTGTAPITFSLVNAPTGMSIDASGRLAWTPAAAQAVVFSIRADNAAGSATQTCIVTARSTTPNQGAPLILRLANPVAAVGLPYFYGPGGRLQADGQPPITWAKTAGPQDLRVDPATGTVTWKPTAAGVQSITVSATNALGSDSYTFDVDVKPAAPSGPRAGIKGGDKISGPAPLVVNADSGDTTSSAKLISWLWSWGDGSADSEGQTATHTYQGCGGYVLRLTVTDEYGQTSTAEQLVAVTCNGLTPPVARIVMPVRTGVGSLNANFSAEITPGSGQVHGQQWLSTDGFSSDLAADTHTFGPGGHTLQLIVVDSNGLTAIDRVTVTVTDSSGNEPPRLVAWAAPSAGTAPLTVQFGQSSVDPDGIIASGSWTFSDGNSTVEAAPVKTYPDPTFDRATYTVTDDKGLSSSAMVGINVLSASGASPPEIISTPRLSIFAGQLYTYDKDGMPSVRGQGPFTFALTAAPEGATINASTGLIEWTPAGGTNGQFDFTLEVSNSAGKATQAWKVEVVSLGGETTTPPPAGCSCNGGAGGLAWFALSGLVAMLRARRRR